SRAILVRVGPGLRRDGKILDGNIFLAENRFGTRPEIHVDLVRRYVRFDRAGASDLGQGNPGSAPDTIGVFAYGCLSGQISADSYCVADYSRRPPWPGAAVACQESAQVIIKWFTA